VNAESGNLLAWETLNQDSTVYTVILSLWIRQINVHPSLFSCLFLPFTLCPVDSMLFIQSIYKISLSLDICSLFHLLLPPPSSLSSNSHNCAFRVWKGPDTMQSAHGVYLQILFDCRYIASISLNINYGDNVCFLWCRTKIYKYYIDQLYASKG
jgi:hypothetical protein